jgi:hypothetical protein
LDVAGTPAIPLRDWLRVSIQQRNIGARGKSAATQGGRTRPDNTD